MDKLYVDDAVYPSRHQVLEKYKRLFRLDCDEWIVVDIRSGDLFIWKQ